MSDKKALKKQLFELYKKRNEPFFFMVGAVIGRVSYRHFYELTQKYNIRECDVDNFLYFELSHKEIAKSNQVLKMSDKVFSWGDVRRALRALKKFTQSIIYYPTIEKLGATKKHFARIPKDLPFFSNLIMYHCQFTPFNALIAADVAYYIFVKEYRMTHEAFEEYLKIFDAETATSNKGHVYYNLIDLAQIEEIIWAEEKIPFIDIDLVQIKNAFTAVLMSN